MRTTLRLAAAAAAASLLTACSGLAAADTGDDMDDLAPIVGAWQATVSPDNGSDPFFNFVTLHSDGTAVNSDVIVAAGVGAWEDLGDDRFRVRLVHNNFYDSQFGNVVDSALAAGTVYVDVHLEVQLSNDGDSAEGTYHTEFKDAAGDLVVFNDTDVDAIIEGAISWDRIEIDDSIEVPSA